MALPVRVAQMDGVLICQCSRRGQTGPVPNREQTTIRGKCRSMMAGPNQGSIKARVNSNRHQDNNHRTGSNRRVSRSSPVNTLRSNHRTHSNRRVSRGMASNSTDNSLLRHHTARSNSTPSRITASPTVLPAG